VTVHDSCVALGIGGEGYLWMMADSTFADQALWAGDDSARLRALKGSFALDVTRTANQDAYNAYLQRRQQLSMMNSVDNACSVEVDSEGNYLWAQDHDNNASTPLSCLAVDPYLDATADTFGYDAVFAVAHALHELLNVQNRSKVDSGELLGTLLNQVRFNGLTGPVDFHDASGSPDRMYHGDRRMAASYDVMNYADNTQGYVTVGAWSTCGSVSCTWSEMWQPNENIGLTFSTSDNSRPQQSASCYYGEVFTHEGRCGCEDDFELDITGERCRRCDVAQTSRRVRWNETGSAGCTLCADHYYRPNAHSPASECTSCASLRGVGCRSNATMQSLILDHGYWRHSAAALETWRCESDGDWSPCRGGADAGHDGDAYCETGYKGPRCERLSA
jgi:hypothetical protein